MTTFQVKITTRHEGCRRTCLMDVIAKDWLKAGRRAIKLVKPVGAHRISVQPNAVIGGAK